jgi:hypothetical protein
MAVVLALMDRAAVAAVVVALEVTPAIAASAMAIQVTEAEAVTVPETVEAPMMEAATLEAEVALESVTPALPVCCIQTQLLNRAEHRGAVTEGF